MSARIHAKQRLFFAQFQAIRLFGETAPSVVATPTNFERQRIFGCSKRFVTFKRLIIKIVGSRQIDLFRCNFGAAIGVDKKHGQRARIGRIAGVEGLPRPLRPVFAALWHKNTARHYGCVGGGSAIFAKRVADLFFHIDKCSIDAPVGQRSVGKSVAVKVRLAAVEGDFPACVLVKRHAANVCFVATIAAINELHLRVARQRIVEIEGTLRNVERTTHRTNTQKNSDKESNSLHFF